MARRKVREEADKRAGGIDPRDARHEQLERDRVAAAQHTCTAARDAAMSGTNVSFPNERQTSQDTERGQGPAFAQ